MREVGGRRPGVRTAEPEVIPPLAKGVPELQRAGADTASVVPADHFLPDLSPGVVGEDPVVVKGCNEVISRRAGGLGGAEACSTCGAR